MASMMQWQQKGAEEGTGAGSQDSVFVLRSNRADYYRLQVLQDMLKAGVELVTRIYNVDAYPDLRPGDTVRVKDEHLNRGDLVYFWDGLSLRVGRCITRLWSSSRISMLVQAGMGGEAKLTIPVSSILGRVTGAWRDDVPLRLERYVS